ncbi:hypothetical protein EXIGLDRAFT_786159 [Exidia glandulosa HHB12029]|uniref:Ankyrin n=1 Tax=Exidia glandulosa HHB12029 TaxID=1314781 RepID=A0A165QZA7_EXIGL|nr:hypothetical protein EXIGLDRAFT_786159 [Exidia glandulosa HHB12029]
MADLEDREGETALHKAALQGRLEIIQYLLSLDEGRADPHATDHDGWTALHNACSKGYLDIVKWLCERGGAGDVVHLSTGSVSGVDRKAKGGWTPLMNAASKGHLPVVLYLLTKQAADPLVRNDWGETAYDVAAAVFEVHIVQVLQRAEAERWRNSPAQYNPLAVHTTVPLILHENQRLDAKLKTLAVSGGRPKFSASGLGRKGRRSPFELRVPPGSFDQTKQDLPAWRSDVQLPLLEDPFQLPTPKGPVREGAERSHFWLSDWTLDLTHPKVDANEGWQYARTFDDPDEQWSAEPPAMLERVLAGSGVLSSPSITGAQANGESSSRTRNLPPTAWVRRRRWVRVMRRRLDIAPLAFLQPDGNMYALSESGALVPVPDLAGGDGQELGAMPTSFLSLSKDYVSRARYLAGTPGDRDASATAADVRRGIAKLERAVLELRTGMLSDENEERKTQAEVLLNAYNRELERRRLAAGAQGIVLRDEDGYGEDDGDSDDESFHYPSSEPSTTRPASIRSGVTPDYFSRPSTSRVPADLTPQLQAAPEFRVPTHEAPQKVMNSRGNTPVAHQIQAQWERDDAVTECRGCHRRFTLFFRKHCRKCGRIFCDRCSSFRVALDPADVVQDPLVYETIAPGTLQRVCQACFDQENSTAPRPLQGARNSSLERIVLDQGHLTAPNYGRDVSSQISDLADCPVCNTNLAELGPAPVQEAHVKNCLDGGAGGSRTPHAGAKYLVYRLPAESPLIGVECVICLEEFAKGSLIARLSCLCAFHNACLSAWLQRGRSCPVHARDT